MKKKLFIKIACSLVLVTILALTAITIYPQAASAQSTKTKALVALEEGVKSSEKGDNGNAEFFYEKAINEVLKNKDVDVLLAAKIRLADIKEKLGANDKAKKLRKQAKALEKALEADTNVAGACGDCIATGGVTGLPRLPRGCSPCVKP